MTATNANDTLAGRSCNLCRPAKLIASRRIDALGVRPSGGFLPEIADPPSDLGP